MKLVRNFSSIIVICFILAGCTSSAEISIDPITGMDKSFCLELKPDMEKANSDFWTLSKSTSMDTFKQSMIEVSQDANSIAIVSVEPAKFWLTAVSVNAINLIRYFSGEGVGEGELLELASRWRTTYLQLPKYCS